MNKRYRSNFFPGLALAIMILHYGQVAYAQEGTVCPTIEPGPDAAGITTCGDEVILSATAGLEDYRWGKYIDGGEEIISSEADSIVVQKISQGSGTYWWETIGTIHGENLINNGDFESGITGIGSEYDFVVDDPTLTNELYPEGAYSISSAPNQVHGGFCAGGDHTSGNGNMMVVNGKSIENQKVWYQTITVSPNTNYIFSVYFTSVHPSNPGELRFSIGGEQLGSAIELSTATCSWEQFYTTWNSGANEGTIEISIVNQNIIDEGNDFAIDDILFAEACTHREDIEVVFLEPATADQIEVMNETACEGSEVTLTPSYINQSSLSAPSTFNWYKDLGKTVLITSGTDPENPDVEYTLDAEGGLTISGLNAGDYTFYVSVQNDEQCENDAGNLKPVNVTVNPNPEVAITALDSTHSYTGDQVDLEISNYNENYVYQWFMDGVEIAGETDSVLTATETGIYKVMATNLGGCSASSGEVSLSFNPAPDITVTGSAISGEICQNEGSISFDVSNTFETDYYRVVSSVGTVVLDWTEIDGSTILLNELGSGGYTLEIYDRYREMADPFLHDFEIADERQIIITPIVKNVQCFDDNPWVGSIRFEVQTIGCGSNNIRVSYKHREDNIYTPEATIGLGGGKSEYINYLDGTTNFPVGVYDFKVRQGGGNCTDCGILDYTITVKGPEAPLIADAVVTQDFSCSGTVFYEATIYPEGGWGGYTYLWSDGQTTQTASFLSPGATYTVQVTDSGGCMEEKTVVIPGEEAVSMNILASLTDPRCGDPNGSIAIDYAGIDPNQYEVTWRIDDPETGTQIPGDDYGITGLSEGTYFLLLSNGEEENCKIIREYTLVEQGTPISVTPSDQEICEGESVIFSPSIDAPAGNYSFNWYLDINKIDPVIDNSELGPQEVTYDIDEFGVLTVSGLSFDGEGQTYSYFVEVTGENVCESKPGELQEVTVAVNSKPAPAEVDIQGGHTRN